MIKPNRVPYTIPQPNNMGVVRYVMAFSVLISHFAIQTGCEDIIWPISSGTAVGGFFAISGFLLVGNYMRTGSWKRYIIRRAKRILPAYWATVLLFALICAVFSTDRHYFTSAQFWEYLAANLAFLNFLQPDLPGVFTENIDHAANGALWTMKVEWMLYLTVPFAVWALKRWRKQSLTVIGAIYLLSVAYKVSLMWLYISTGEEIFNMFARQFISQLMYFYTGVLIYYYFDTFMKYRWWILPVAMAALGLFSNNQLFQITLQPFFVSTAVLWFCMVGKWGTFEGKKDNISYNIYLVHWPVIQIAAMYSLIHKIGVWNTFLATCAVIIAIAWLINIAVERPVDVLIRRKQNR